MLQELQEGVLVEAKEKRRFDDEIIGICCGLICITLPKQ